MIKKLLEQLKTRFKRTIKWNKYKSEMIKQTKTNYLNYLIDPTLNKVNRLFVLSFENEEDRTSFSKYYTPKGSAWRSCFFACYYTIFRPG